MKHMQKSYTIQKSTRRKIIEVNLKFNLYTYVAVWTFIIICVKCIRKISTEITGGNCQYAGKQNDCSGEV